MPGCGFVMKFNVRGTIAETTARYTSALGYSPFTHAYALRSSRLRSITLVLAPA
jgi:hypothetical protein